MKLSFPEIFPELITDRLKLRMINGGDAELIFNFYSNEKVMFQRGEPVFENGAQAEKLIFHWRKLFAEENGLRWGIEWKENRQLVGTIGMKKIFHQHLRADIGYELDPAYWNKGIMTEALQAVAQFGFEKMNLHSLEANITPAHIASQRVLEKSGFTPEALYRENYFYKGWWDSAIWSKRK